MEKQEFHQLLQKLATGDLLPEEAARLREALAEEGTQHQGYLYSLDAWEDALNGLPPTAEEKAKAAHNFEAVLQQLKQEEEAPVVPITSRSWWHSARFRAACLIGFMLALGSGVFWLSSRQKTSSMIQPALAWQRIDTRLGERSKLTLPDGSVIYLNGGTILKYPKAFSGKIREVELVSGEIFLEVKRNEAQPFRVRTDSLTVQVLGTSFSVANRPSAQKVSVAVKTGKVSFASINNVKQVLLTPGKTGVFNKQDGYMQEMDCNKDAIAGWTRNEFVFEDATLADILNTLENSYGFHYRIMNKKLAGKRFRVSFNQHTPEEIVRALSRIGDFQYTIKDSTIIIK